MNGCWRWAVLVRDVLTIVCSLGGIAAIVAGAIWLTDRSEAREEALQLANPTKFAARRRRHERVALTAVVLVVLFWLAAIGRILFQRWYGC